MSQTKIRALELLNQSLGRNDADFHEHQWESISTLVDERKRLLVVQRTGWGKSAVYFISTKLMREAGYGPTIIISPLLALMRNQIESAKGYGIHLGSISSAYSKEENEQTGAKLLNDEYDAIIISPEQLSNPNFSENILRVIADRVGLFVIDEAHCISDWGHDFRPDYRRIKNILTNLPANLPVIATTATANQRVMDDIITQLGDDIRHYRGKLTRESLHLQCINYPKRSQRLAWLADTLPQIEGTGIIYTATTNDAENVTQWLKSQGINAEAYYGNLKGLNSQENRAERERREEALLNNYLKVLVATSALGMGYDKPDLAFVIHYQSPGSAVSYYQQVGRAGRGIPKALGILLSGSEDDDIQNFFIQQAFPQEALVEEILHVLDESMDGMTLREIEKQVNARHSKVEAAIKFLLVESPAPLVLSNLSPKKYSRTTIEYQLPHETIARLSGIKQQEWQVMQTYFASENCLMQFLSHELDDNNTVPCGKCMNCDPESMLSVDFSHDTAVAAAEFLENIFIEIPPKKQVGNSAERFPIYDFPYKFGVLEHMPGRVLCRWGEAGWGEIAKQGKQQRHFDDRLVVASAKLIRERWDLEPFPSWITFVPSHRHPELVSDFAQRLAEHLGIRYLDVVKKVKHNSAQKNMENAEFRCNNLDGAFEINMDAILDESVLLIDDAVDSGWTFAVVSALLLRTGSGPVFPFALMSTSTGS